MTSFAPLQHREDSAVVALGAPWTTTQRELLVDASALVDRLSPEPGEVVVACEDRYHVAVAALAAWALGHTIALPPSGQPAAIERLARGPRARAVLHDGRGEWIDGAAPVLDIRERVARADDVDPRVGAPLPAERPLATVYTSGSTGDALACEKTAAQLLGEAAVLARHFELAGARVVATVPAHHIYGLLFGVLAPLAAGAAFHRQAPLHAEPLLALVRRDGLDVLVSVPAHLRGLEVLEPGALAGLRRVFSSGAPLPPATAALARARAGVPVTEVFGSSETGGVAWRTSPGDARWRPLPGVRVGAAGDGRLRVESPWLGAPGPVTTEDAVELAPDGTFTHLGRVDGVVKVGGKRVALAEVERLLLAQPGVRDAAVVAVPAPGGREQELVAAVTPAGLDPAALRAALRDELDPVVAPRRVHAVDALPREASGKLPRARLLALLGIAGARPAEVRVGPARETGPGERTLEVAVPPDLAAFEGHFDAFPLLPGVFQLERIVLAQARAAWPDLGALRAVRKLKFARAIRPGETLSLRLARAGTDVEFELTCAGAPCTSGVLVLR